MQTNYVCLSSLSKEKKCKLKIAARDRRPNNITSVSAERKRHGTIANQLKAAAEM
jgi:hypothetical protein